MAPISTPRVGCAMMSTSGSVSTSRAITIFCWLPPEKFAVLSMGLGGAHVKTRHLAGGICDGRLLVDEEALAVIRVVLPAENGAFMRGKNRHEAHALPVLGTWARPIARRCRHGHRRAGLAADEYLAGAPGHHPGKAFDEFGLGHCPTRRQGRGFRRRAPKTRGYRHAEPARIRDREIAHLEQHILARNARCADGLANRATHHEFGEFLRVGLARLAMRDHFAAPHHGDMIRDRHDFLELVGDEQDRRPCRRSSASARNNCSARRRENAGRFIENDDLRSAIERLDDLHPLLLAHGEFTHDRIGVDLNAVFRAETDDFRAGLCRPPSVKAPPSMPSITFSATLIVSTSMKC